MKENNLPATYLCELLSCDQEFIASLEQWYIQERNVDQEAGACPQKMIRPGKHPEKWLRLNG